MYGGGGMFGGGGGGMGRMGPPGGGGGGMGPGRLSRATDLTDEEVFGKVYDHKVAARLLGYLRDYKFRFLLAAVGMLVFTVTSLLMPALFGNAIDIATGQLDNPAFHPNIMVSFSGRAFGVTEAGAFLTVIFGLYIGNGLVNWLGQYIQLYIMAYIGRGVLYTLRMQMFTHLQKLSLSFYDRHEVGRVMSRVQNDIAALQEVVSTGVLEIIADFLSLGIVIFMIFSMNFQLALITMTVIPVLFVIVFFYERLSRNAFMRIRQSISVVNAGLQENISGARVIQALSRENVNLRRFGNLNEANLDANLQATRLSSGLMSSVEVLVGISTVLVIIFGGMQVAAGTLFVGQLVAFVLYVNRFFEPIRSLSMQYTQLQRATAGGLRIFEVLDMQPEIKDAPDAI